MPTSTTNVAIRYAEYDVLSAVVAQARAAYLIRAARASTKEQRDQWHQRVIAANQYFAAANDRDVNDLLVRIATVKEDIDALR